jgi:hypothetical protein
MKKLTKGLATAALIAGAVFAAPVAANAATYTPGVPDTTVSTATVGGPFALTFQAGVFTPNAPLTATFSSAGPVPTSATATGVFHAATAGPVAVGSANAAGGVTLRGTVPASATSDITVTVTDGTNTAVGTINVVAAPAGAGSAATAGTSGLATTGTYISLATVWGAVGLVALGGGFLVVRSTRKRQGSTTSASL